MNDATPITILASGRGSNFEAIEGAIRDGKLRARVAQVISDREDAPVLEKARRAGIKAAFVQLKGLSREAQDQALLDAIGAEKSRFLVLSGFMRILGRKVIEAFSSGTEYPRVVNVHPALLPAFPGLRSYEQAFQYGCAVTGATVHLVDEKMDHGPICAQETFSITDCRSAEEVENRGLAVEHRLYSQTLSWLLEEKFQWIERKDAALSESRRFCVRPS